MTSTTDSARRAFMSALSALPLANAGAAIAAEKPGSMRLPESRILVAYFSRSGNTRVIAGLLHRSLNADLFEIVPATPYPDDYLETVAMAKQERDDGRVRALGTKALDMARYDTVYLGFPIWGETVPPVIRAFLADHPIPGKALIPFITHGGYGLGDSQSVLARLAPKADLRKGLTMEADQERRTMGRVNDWLKNSSAKK